MTSQLENELSCIKYCWDVYEQNNIVNNVHVGDWTAELVIIASNVLFWMELIYVHFECNFIWKFEVQIKFMFKMLKLEKFCSFFLIF